MRALSLPSRLAIAPLVGFLPLLPLGGFLLPLLAPGLIWIDFREALEQRRYGRAWRIATSWAMAVSFGVVVATLALPHPMQEGVLGAHAYRQEMFTWIETGVGREGNWREFLPQHLLHLAVFLLLTRLVGGYAGLALGAGLVAYMSVFVAAIGLASGRLLIGPIAAWFPWALVRVGGFIALGAVTAGARLRRKGERVWGRQEIRWAGIGAVCILLDWFLKAWLAPAYRKLLATWLASPLP